MKVKIQGVRKIAISGDFIKLDSLLKYASLASTGGEAKLYIQNGDVFVNGEPCDRRGRKIKPGYIVKFRNDVLRICT